MAIIKMKIEEKMRIQRQQKLPSSKQTYEPEIFPFTHPQAFVKLVNLLQKTVQPVGRHLQLTA